MSGDTIGWSRKGREFGGILGRGGGPVRVGSLSQTAFPQEQAEVPGEDKKNPMTIHRLSCDMSLIERTELHVTLTQTKTHTSA